MDYNLYVKLKAILNEQSGQKYSKEMDDFLNRLGARGLISTTPKNATSISTSSTSIVISTTGNNTVVGTTNASTVISTTGNNTVVGTTNASTVISTTGNNTVVGTTNASTVISTTGNNNAVVSGTVSSTMGTTADPNGKKDPTLTYKPATGVDINGMSTEVKAKIKEAEDRINGELVTALENARKSGYSDPDFQKIMIQRKREQLQKEVDKIIAESKVSEVIPPKDNGTSEAVTAAVKPYGTSTDVTSNNGTNQRENIPVQQGENDESIFPDEIKRELEDLRKRVRKDLDYNIQLAIDLNRGGSIEQLIKRAGELLEEQRNQIIKRYRDAQAQQAQQGALPVADQTQVLPNNQNTQILPADQSVAPQTAAAQTSPNQIDQNVVAKDRKELRKVIGLDEVYANMQKELSEAQNKGTARGIETMQAEFHFATGPILSALQEKIAEGKGKLSQEQLDFLMNQAKQQLKQLETDLRRKYGISTIPSDKTMVADQPIRAEAKSADAPLASGQTALSGSATDSGLKLPSQTTRGRNNSAEGTAQTDKDNQRSDRVRQLQAFGDREKLNQLTGYADIMQQFRKEFAGVEDAGIRRGLERAQEELKQRANSIIVGLQRRVEEGRGRLTEEDLNSLVRQAQASIAEANREIRRVYKLRAPKSASMQSDRILKVLKAMQNDLNQNNKGNNQYVNPDEALPEPSNALNTTAPVNGTFSTSNMEQQKLQRTSGNFNSATGNANPTGYNGVTSDSINSTVSNTSSSQNFSPSSDSSIQSGGSVLESIKNQLKNKSFYNRAKTKAAEDNTEQQETDEDGKLPLATDDQVEVDRFYEYDPLVDLLDGKKKGEEEKSMRIKLLLKSLNSLSEEDAVFKDIKNARKYAKIFNTKLASLGEHAELAKPTLQDIKKFGKKISVRVNIKKY